MHVAPIQTEEGGSETPTHALASSTRAFSPLLFLRPQRRPSDGDGDGDVRERGTRESSNGGEGEGGRRVREKIPSRKVNMWSHQREIGMR